jgi:hypothetical protein
MPPREPRPEGSVQKVPLLEKPVEEASAPRYPSANLEAAIAAFRHDLPQLLRDHPGKWVAYRGSQQVGIATDDFDLYEACYEAGFDLSDFVVECIEQETGDSVLIGPGIIRNIPSSEQGT